MKKLVLVLLAVSVAVCVFAKSPDLPTINGVPSLFGTDVEGNDLTKYRPAHVGADGALKTTGAFTATIGSVTVDVVPAFMEDSTTASSAILTPEGYVPVSIEKGSVAVTLPVASATANSADSLPVALGASDNSSLQRLFTALVMGDGVNGNNMLPFAAYFWNGSSYDRMVGSAAEGLLVKLGSIVGSMPVNIVGSAIDLDVVLKDSTGNSIGSTSNPLSVAVTSAPAGEKAGQPLFGRIGVATDTATLFSATAGTIATDAGYLITFEQASWMGPASTTAAAVVASGTRMTADKQLYIKPGTAIDFAILGDGAIASFSWIKLPLM